MSQDESNKKNKSLHRDDLAVKGLTETHSKVLSRYSTVCFTERPTTPNPSRKKGKFYAQT